MKRMRALRDRRDRLKEENRLTVGPRQILQSFSQMLKCKMKTKFPL